MSWTKFYSQSSCDIDEFNKLVSRRTDIKELRYASDVQGNIPIYQVADLLPLLVGEEHQNILTERA